jgi:transposase-like protein
MNSEENRRQFWQRHLRRCREQGTTLKAYAEQEGLTLSVLYRWSRRLKREAATASPFSQVVIAPAPAQYRLSFPNGLVLEWSGEVDVAQLARLVSGLT